MLWFRNVSCCIEILARHFAKKRENFPKDSFKDPVSKEEAKIRKEALKAGYQYIAHRTGTNLKTVLNNRGPSCVTSNFKTARSVFDTFFDEFEDTPFLPKMEDSVLSLLELHNTERKKIGKGGVFSTDPTFIHIDRLADGLMAATQDSVSLGVLCTIRAKIRSDITEQKLIPPTEIENPGLESTISTFNQAANHFAHAESPLLIATTRINIGVAYMLAQCANDTIGNEKVITNLEDVGSGQSFLSYAEKLWTDLEGADWTAAWVAMIGAGVSMQEVEMKKWRTRLDLAAGGKWPGNLIPHGQDRSLYSEEYLQGARDKGWV